MFISEVHSQGNQGVTPLLEFAQETFHLPPVEQQFSGPLRIMAVHRGVGVRADMGVIEKNFPVPEAGVSIVDIGPPLAQGLDFGALQHHPGLIEGVDGIIEVGLAVAADDLQIFFFLFFHNS